MNPATLKSRSLSLAIATSFAIFASSAALAATSGSITLKGTIAAATAITVTAVAPYNALDLSQSQTDLVVANVREINNTTNGYKVELASANAGSLKNGTIGSLTYTAKYNGSAVSLSTTPVQVTTAAPSNSVVNVVKNFAISYTGVAPETLPVGNYTDTLTFTVTAL